MIQEDEFHAILKILTRKGFWTENDSEFYNRQEDTVSFYMTETGGRITIDWPDDASG